MGSFEFDIFGANRRKWCQDDISAIYSVVKAIADVYKNSMSRNRMLSIIKKQELLESGW